MKRLFVIGLLLSTFFSTGFLSTQITTGMNVSLAQEEFTDTPIPVDTETPFLLPTDTPIWVPTETPVVAHVYTDLGAAGYT